MSDQKQEHDGDITPGMNSYYGDDVGQVKAPIQKPRRAWGAGGQRWDETCACCGKETVIDNETELCKKCGS
jgi:hypothetical protein